MAQRLGLGRTDAGFPGILSHRTDHTSVCNSERRTRLGGISIHLIFPSAPGIHSEVKSGERLHESSGGAVLLRVLYLYLAPARVEGDCVNDCFKRLSRP